MATLALLLARRHEALEFLEPVLDEDYFGDGLALTLPELRHQESLAVAGDVPGADRSSHSVSRLFKQQERLAGGKTGPGLNINHPDMASHPCRPVIQLLAAWGPEGP